jgi:hypothetical protein
MRNPETWGPWHLDPDNLVLWIGHVRHPDVSAYEVDLERCLTSAAVLDWICQVAGKSWADDAVTAGVVRALDDVLHPQRRLCSFAIGAGKGRQLDLEDVAELVADAERRWPRRCARPREVA